MKVKFYLISLLFTLLNCPSVWSASCGGFTMDVGVGTGSISCTSGEKNIHYTGTNDVEQVNGPVKTVLFSNVTILDGYVHDIGPNGAKSGSFSIDASVWDTWDSIYVALKAGDNYGLFLLTKSIDSGTWETGKNGLSHYLAFGGTPGTVPVPAAVWLFGSGLLGLVGSAKRKSKN